MTMPIVNGPRHVYLAGPYSSDPEGNTIGAIQVASMLIDYGFRPFVPHLSHYIEQRHPKPYEVWMQIDFDWIGRCDVLWRLEGKSSGADREVEYAKAHGITVVHGLDELLGLRECGECGHAFKEHGVWCYGDGGDCTCNGFADVHRGEA